MNKETLNSYPKKEQLCAFITLLQGMGFDVIAFDGRSFKVKNNEDKH